VNSFSPLPQSSPPWADTPPQLPTLDQIEAELARREAEERRDALNRDADAIRARCKSLFGFVKEAWSIIEPKTPLVTGWVVEAICAHLEAVTRGDITRLLINVPPGTMKSTLVSIMWPAWEWGPMGLAHLRYLATSYSGPNVVRDTTKMGALVTSDWYQRLWGANVQPSDKWGEKLIRNRATGQREGRPFSKLTGGRGDRVLVDDPHDTESAESDVQRQKSVRTFRESITDRLNDPERSAIVVIMQRLHERDVAGEILRLKLPYVHLNLPMEFERTRKEGGRLIDATCRTYIGGELFFEDPRSEDGDLLFPERFGRQAVEDLKHAKGAYAWSGQYQQRPTPREGGLFKREWFEGTGEPGTSKIIEKAPPCVAWVRAWDLAGTEKRSNTDPDRSAGTLMGRTADNRFIIAHVDKFMASPGGTETRLKSVAAADGKAVPIRLPEDPGQAGKYQIAAYVRALVGWTVRTVRPSGSKETRAGPLATQAEHGNVYLVQGEWVNDWLDEVCNFPNARYDDQVDSGADAFNDLAPAVGDNRHASSGSRRSAGVIEESREAEMLRRASQQRSGGFSAGSRRTGIL
jgi:predicted phage terminase large subunit-like protein